MKLKIYKNIFLTLALFAISAINSLNAQNQGLYADTVKWPNSNAITVNIRASHFSNVLNFQGSIKWDKNSLQFVSVAGNAALTASNYLFGTGSAVSQGVLTYIYSDAAANHTVPDGTIIMSINFTVINNPLSTYNDNVIYFSNTPTIIGIDTAADIAGLSDLATLNSPNAENHTSGYVSFARPPVISYAAGNVTDSITNRPAGCTYQWTLDGNNVAGTSISAYNNSLPGQVCLSITYPNGTTVSCLGGAITPVKLTSFNGKIEDSKALLYWTTVNEINNKGFAIERSFDGINFNQIGFVNADNSVAVQHSYAFSDVFSNKVTWYRLKQVDDNGKFSYSNSIRLAANTKGTTFVYPNPTRGSVRVEGDKISNVSISNTLGKVVLKQDFASVNAATLNITSLSKGVYLVSIKTANATSLTKLIVE